MKKFWIVWTQRLWNGNRYDSYEKAVEALRELEINNPGVLFTIMVSCVKEPNE